MCCCSMLPVNALFTALVPRLCSITVFAGFIAPAAWQVLVVFKAAPELCNLLKAVEEEYRRGREGGLHQRSRLDGPYADVLPWIQSQAAVFETGGKASCRDVNIPLAVSCSSCA